MSVVWRARSASDQTDDWPFWYVTNDRPPNSNKTLDAIERLAGRRPVGLPFVSRTVASRMAEMMNERAIREDEV